MNTEHKHTPKKQITAADFKNPKMSWRVSGKDFSIEVSRHMETPIPDAFSYNDNGPYRWCVYAYIYPNHPLFGQFDPESKSIYHGCLSDAPLHGGSSYFRKHTDGEKITSFQFGADYNHSGDKYYTTLETKEDAMSVFGDACRLHDWLTEAHATINRGERKGPLRAFVKSECVEGETYVRESDHAARLSASHSVISELRSIFPDICEALGNGSFCTGDNSIEFLREIPKEVALVIKGKDALIGEYETALRKIKDKAEALQKIRYGPDGDCGADRLANLIEEDAERALMKALRRADGKEGA